MDKHNANGETPLHLASRYDHTRAMNLLIGAGAEVDARRRFDKSTVSQGQHYLTTRPPFPRTLPQTPYLAPSLATSVATSLAPPRKSLTKPSHTHAAPQPLGVACLFNSEAAARILVKHGASLTPAGSVSPAAQVTRAHIVALCFTDHHAVQANCLRFKTPK